MNNINIQKMKLFILQKKYFEICNSVRVIQEHLNFLNKNNFIEILERNVVLSQLLEISKNINSKYNEYINNEIESSESSDSSELSELKGDSNIFNSLASLEECFKDSKIDILNIDNKPLEDYSNKILEIIEKYGYGNLINTLKVFIGEVKFTLLDTETLNFLNEICGHENIRTVFA